MTCLPQSVRTHSTYIAISRKASLLVVLVLLVAASLWAWGGGGVKLELINIRRGGGGGASEDVNSQSNSIEWNDASKRATSSSSSLNNCPVYTREYYHYPVPITTTTKEEGGSDHSGITKVPPVGFIKGSAVAVGSGGRPVQSRPVGGDGYEDCAVKLLQQQHQSSAVTTGGGNTLPFPLQLKCGAVTTCSLPSASSSSITSNLQAENLDLVGCKNAKQQAPLFLPPLALVDGVSTGDSSKRYGSNKNNSPALLEASLTPYILPDAQRCGVTGVMQRFCFDFTTTGFVSNVPVCGTRMGGRWGFIVNTPATTTTTPAPKEATAGAGEDGNNNKNNKPPHDDTLIIADDAATGTTPDASNNDKNTAAAAGDGGDDEGGGGGLKTDASTIPTSDLSTADQARRSHLARVVGAAFIESSNPHSLKRIVRQRGKAMKGVLMPVTDEIRDVRRYVLTSRTAPGPYTPISTPHKEGSVGGGGGGEDQTSSSTTTTSSSSPSTPTSPIDAASTRTVHLMYLHRKHYDANLGHTLMRVLGLHAQATKLQYEHKMAFINWENNNNNIQKKHHHGGDKSTSSAKLHSNHILKSVAPGAKSHDGRFHYEPLRIKIVIALKEGASTLRNFFLPLLSAGLSETHSAIEVIITPDDGSRLHPVDPSIVIPSEEFIRGNDNNDDDDTDHGGGGSGLYVCPLTTKASINRKSGDGGSNTRRVAVWPYQIPMEATTTSTTTSGVVLTTTTSTPTPPLNQSSSEAVDQPPQQSSKSNDNNNNTKMSMIKKKRRNNAFGFRAEVVCFENALMGYTPIYFGDGYLTAYVGDASPQYVGDFIARKRRSGGSSGSPGLNIKWKKKKKGGKGGGGGAAAAAPQPGDGGDTTTSTVAPAAADLPPAEQRRQFHAQAQADEETEDTTTSPTTAAQATPSSSPSPPDSAPFTSTQTTTTSSPSSPPPPPSGGGSGGESSAGQKGMFNLNPRFLVDGVRAYRDSMAVNWDLPGRCRRRLLSLLPNTEILTIIPPPPSPLPIPSSSSTDAPTKASSRRVLLGADTNVDTEPPTVIKNLVKKPPVTKPTTTTTTAPPTTSVVTVEEGEGDAPNSTSTPTTAAGGASPSPSPSPPPPPSYLGSHTLLLPPPLLSSSDKKKTTTSTTPTTTTPIPSIKGSFSHQDRILRVLVVNRRGSRRINNVHVIKEALLAMFDTTASTKYSGDADNHDNTKKAANINTSPSSSSSKVRWGLLEVVPSIEGGTSPFMDASATSSIYPGSTSANNNNNKATQPSTSTTASSAPAATGGGIGSVVGEGGGGGARRISPEEMFETDRRALMADMGITTTTTTSQSRTPWGVSIQITYMEDYYVSTPTTTMSNETQLSLAEQAAAHHCADVVVMVHGAALGWTVAMQPGATLIEILPPFWGGGIVRLNVPNQGAITYSNNVHHHLVSCGGKYTMGQVVAGGVGGVAVGGYMGALDARFDVPNPEIRQVQWLVITGMRRSIALAQLMARTNKK